MEFTYVLDRLTIHQLLKTAAHNFNDLAIGVKIIARTQNPLSN